MDEFINRMDKQRIILELINSYYILNEELFGLSKNAIERWLRTNNIPFENNIALVLFKISDKLFFLASKSQEQISEEYKDMTFEIDSLQNQLENFLHND